MTSREYTADDYRYDTPPRHFGSETEYTMQLPQKTGEYWNTDSLTPPDSVILARGEDDSIITPNGGFFYMDNDARQSLPPPNAARLMNSPSMNG